MRLIILSISIESRHIQQISLKVSPVQINYAPDGKSLLYVSGGNQLFFMTYGQGTSEDATADGKPVIPKEEWQISDRDTVRPGKFYLARLQLKIVNRIE